MMCPVITMIAWDISLSHHIPHAPISNTMILSFEYFETLLLSHRRLSSCISSDIEKICLLFRRTLQ